MRKFYLAHVREDREPHPPPRCGPDEVRGFREEDGADGLRGLCEADQVRQTEVNTDLSPPPQKKKTSEL